MPGIILSARPSRLRRTGGRAAVCTEALGFLLGTGLCPTPTQKKRPSPSAPASTPKRARTTTKRRFQPALSCLSPANWTTNQKTPLCTLQPSPTIIAVLSENAARNSDKADAKEKAAYTSITQKDESVVAWIIKQPVSEETDFYSSTQTPYLTACTLLEKARVLGNQSSQYHAAQFLQAWRERGSPFRGGGELAGSQSKMHTGARCLQLLSVRDDADREFCFAWNMCTRYEAELAAVHIESRWASALLGQAYSKKIAQIRHNDFISSNDRTRNRYGKGPVRTEQLQRWTRGNCWRPISEKKTLSIEAEAPATIYE
ncbi:hypothetical protein PTTW11_11463 [Pyrenophora teres f. teres]|uniref:Uncharacterized protein n=1 Tax=Pyrenophora teres f. teres TaxID=97479 RepID=A0A6S6WLY8_9PLEO|nr:hypothetical protein PTTW11_11463 [Pyrenophora teres f. teres]